MPPRKWKLNDLSGAAAKATSFRGLLRELGLIPAGGNYAQIHKYVRQHGIDTSHFKGSGWNRGLKGTTLPRIPLTFILRKGSTYQSFKLKHRLFVDGLKQPICEECGWAKQSEDGRIPVELDHINGDRCDNRLKNLRVLCPNCHSLKPTHRGRNIGK